MDPGMPTLRNEHVTGQRLEDFVEREDQFAAIETPKDSFFNKLRNRRRFAEREELIERKHQYGKIGERLAFSVV